MHYALLCHQPRALNGKPMTYNVALPDRAYMFPELIAAAALAVDKDMLRYGIELDGRMWRIEPRDATILGL